MSSEIKTQSKGHALSLGRTVINRNPLNLLETLHANICYHGSVGYCIVLNEYDRKQILECIQFNRGDK